MFGIFNFLSGLENFIWTYIAIPIIVLFGIYLTIYLKFPQIFKFKDSLSTFYNSIFDRKSKVRGVHPLSAFFTSIGGCIGIANLVSVCYALKIGGPGAIFWMWIAAFLGMSVKYSEVYLGIKYRIENKSGSYDGGPMFYIQKVINNKFLPIIISFLLCIYGVEIYMFDVIVESLNTNWQLNKYLLIILLLFAIIFAGKGGIARVGKVSSIIIPFFLILFLIMSSWVLFKNSSLLLNSFLLIFKSAFSTQAAVGGFAGSSIILAMTEGMKRGCYTGDIGIGYAAVVHAESSSVEPVKQASLSILGIVLDTFVICTLTTLIVLVTDTWKLNISSSIMTQTALSRYFPQMNIFMPIFIFLLGYSTIIAFFTVGLKCAKFISPKWGPKFYYLYAISGFCIFSFIETEMVLSIMAICGGLLLIINLFGIFKLRKVIK